MGTPPPAATETGVQNRQRTPIKTFLSTYYKLKVTKHPPSLDNRGSHLRREMGVEQKPIFVTQVDKLEAKIQALCHASLVGRQSSYSPYSQFLLVQLFCVLMGQLFLAAM